MPRVLIAGCGYVGKATAELFQTAGWKVECWTATAGTAAGLEREGFVTQAVDIGNRDAVAAAASDFEVVLQCASSGGGSVEAYRHVYLAGARNLAAVFPRTLLLFTSSTSVYAQTDGEWVTEESEANPQRETGRILRESEEVVLAAGGVVARLAGIYGPGRSALLRKFLDGTAVLDPASDRFINQAHRDDIAAALLLLAQRYAGQSQPASETISLIYNVSDNDPISQHDCYAWLAGKLNRPLPREVPTQLERKRGRSNKRVSSEKLQALGWQPRYPSFASGMSESILPSLK